MHVLESQKPLSESLLWRLQREFFERSGPEAWSRGTVPHYITSNPFIAAAYAQVVWGWIQDCCRAGIDARQPLYILEIASGSGRFAFNFLTELFRLIDRSPLRDVSVTYVMSDFAQRTVDAWLNHPSLARFTGRRALDFARFDAERDQEVQLLKSGQRLAPGALKNPLAVIANYYFDGVPQDSFRVEDGRLYENLATLTTGEPDAPALERVSLQYHPAPLADARYDEPAFDRILRRYQERLGNTSFSFPIAGLRCCRFLRRLAKDRLLLMSGDKGTSQEAALLDGEPPAMALHGSFSMGVNYHAIGEYFRDAGGDFLTAPHQANSLSVVACLLGEARGELTHTRHAFADAVERFGPDDFFLMKKASEPHFRDFSLPQILALVRLARWDARIFEQCLPSLFERAAQASSDERRELVRVIDQVWDQYFPIGEESDLASSLGILLMNMGCLPQAIDYFRRAVEGAPRNDAALFHLGMCCFQLRQLGEAESWLARLLAKNPNHGPARALRLEIERLAPPLPVEKARLEAV
jgi:tetratricopeptide (TPR) repeat protein